MIKLTERQKMIVDDFLNYDVPISAKELAHKFDVSIRTVRYDLDSIEDWLRLKKISLIKKPNVGIFLQVNDEEREELSQTINSLDFKSRILSIEERQNIMLLELLKTIEPITSECLANKLDISRTTAIKDLKEIKFTLKDYKIELIGRQRNGYIISGNENDMRNLIGSILLQSTSKSKLLEILTEAKSSKSDVESDLLNLESLKNISNIIKINDIKKLIKETKKKYDFWIPDSSYVSLLVHLTIAVDRLIKGKKIQISQKKIFDIKKYKEYFIAEIIAEKLTQKYDIKIPQEEVANITIHLISSNLRLNYILNEYAIDREKFLEEIVMEMTESVKGSIDIDELNYNKLQSDLIAHLKITLKKHDLDIIPENPLIEQIKADFVDEFELSKRMNKIFSEKTGINLPEGEIGYLALHLAASKEVSTQIKSKTVLVVCSTGKGSAKILAGRLKNRIPQLVIKKVVSMFELDENKSLLDDVDMIISTVYLKDIKKPVMKVSPIISNLELEKIKEYTNKNNFHSALKNEQYENYILDSIMNVVEKYISIDDREKLKTELSYLIDFLVNNTNKYSKHAKLLEEFVHMSSLILVEIGEMLKEISGEFQLKNDLGNLWGIAIHIIMAIPRWQTGKYYKEENLQKYKQENIEIYLIIKKHLDKISDNFNIHISDTEIVAIMRYII